MVDVVLHLKLIVMINFRRLHNFPRIGIFLVEILPERHQRLEALDFLGTARKDNHRRQVYVEAVVVDFHFQLVVYQRSKGFCKHPLLFIKDNAKTPAVKIIELALVSEIFVQRTKLVRDNFLHLNTLLIAEHRSN